MDVFNVKGGVFVFLHLGRITDEKPKSFVIAEIDKMSKVYLSPISSSTLTKRTDINYNP